MEINVINNYVVDIFNQVIDIEEKVLQQSQFKNLSVKEMHAIEAIGMYRTPISSEIASKLHLSNSTITSMVNQLVRKGYVTRVYDETDRRVVKLQLTKTGRLIYRLHRKFHQDMIARTLAGMDEDEVKSLVKGVKNLYTFLQDTWEALDKED